jgi:hypothetical protein
MENLKTSFISEKTGSVITAEGRLSYAQHLFTPNPEAKTKKGDAKFTLSILLPPDSDLTAMKKAAQDAINAKWPVGSTSRPKNPKSPFLDAGEKAGAAFDGWTLIRVSTTRRPGVIEADGKPAAQEDVYSGRWARLSLNAAAFEVDGNKGVSFFLNNVQMLRHDDPIGGGAPKATSDFEVVTTNTTDPESLFG